MEGTRDGGGGERERVRNRGRERRERERERGGGGGGERERKSESEILIPGVERANLHGRAKDPGVAHSPFSLHQVRVHKTRPVLEKMEKWSIMVRALPRIVEVRTASKRGGTFHGLPLLRLYTLLFFFCRVLSGLPDFWPPRHPAFRQGSHTKLGPFFVSERSK
jgi:hypothetical protein